VKARGGRPQKSKQRLEGSKRSCDSITNGKRGQYHKKPALANKEGDPEGGEVNLQERHPFFQGEKKKEDGGRREGRGGAAEPFRGAREKEGHLVRREKGDRVHVSREKEAPRGKRREKKGYSSG